MSGHEDPSSIKKLDARLKAARDQRDRTSGRGLGKGRDGGPSGLGIGMRMATEIVAAIVVGVGIGLVLDSWLGTKPWMMLLFLLIGCAAALLNVVRAGRELDRQARERKRKAAEALDED